MDAAGDTTEGKLAAGLAVEGDVVPQRHLDDPPLSLDGRLAWSWRRCCQELRYPDEIVGQDREREDVSMANS